jgi:para-aminobenzoate synthetase
MRTLLIDNYDSFTYNLFHLMERVNGHPPTVLRNDDPGGLRALDLATVDAVVVSPGPGRPDDPRDFGISAWAFDQTELPVLGVCLGHQGLCHQAGATVDRAPEPVHGRVSEVLHDGTGLFAGLPSPLRAVRYHSLVASRLPATVEPLAHTADGLLMAARHRDRPQWGVQFHPESVSTEYGEQLLDNFRRLALAARGRSAPGRTRSAVAGPPTRPAPDRSPYRLHVRELVHLPDAEAAFATLFGADPAGFWLDSSRVIPGLSRFSILGGSGPLAERIEYSVAAGEVTVRRPDGELLARHREDLFTYLDRSLAERRLPDAGLPSDFNLGYVGYLGYELKADTGGAAVHRSAQPDASLLFCDRGLLIDHATGQAWLLALSRRDDPAPAGRWLDQASVLLRRAEAPESPEQGEPRPIAVSARHSDAEYGALIERCHEQIRAGESYEICLTNMLSVPVSVDPFPTYQVLRRRNPAPYSAFLRYPDFAVLSSSPERFLRVDRHAFVESKPIKGTRPRGATAEQDERLRAELSGSEKDRAENLMIIDLVRNDLGQVCRPDTVHVPELFAIESYQTVHQLVSTIRGELSADVSAVGCVRAAFPGGSMTGAPKLRTMEILDRLEDGARGVYSGAIGFFSLNGAADLNIVIRTMVVTPDEVTIGVGGAITILSDPAEEIEETWVKARALLDTLSAVSTPADRELAGMAAPR